MENTANSANSNLLSMPGLNFPPPSANYPFMANPSQQSIQEFLSNHSTPNYTNLMMSPWLNSMAMALGNSANPGPNSALPGANPYLNPAAVALSQYINNAAVYLSPGSTSSSSSASNKPNKSSININTSPNQENSPNGSENQAANSQEAAKTSPNKLSIACILPELNKKSANGDKKANNGFSSPSSANKTNENKTETATKSENSELESDGNEEDGKQNDPSELRRSSSIANLRFKAKQHTQTIDQPETNEIKAAASSSPTLSSTSSSSLSSPQYSHSSSPTNCDANLSSSSVGAENTISPRVREQSSGSLNSSSTPISC
jgi:hypothetical protein